jgi:chaperonin GroES
VQSTAGDLSKKIVALSGVGTDIWLETRGIRNLGRDRARLTASSDHKKRRIEATTVMKIRPLGDRIVIKRITEEDKTKGGIIIPDTAKEKPQEGKVVAVGKGKVTESGKLLAPEVRAGDRILFGKYSGSEVMLDAEEHLILRESDILGVLEG